MNFKKFIVGELDVKSVYHLLISGISPRPIALVGSLDENGISNLAPFSFFNAFGANPPIIGFSPALSGRTGLPKDTLLNIKAYFATLLITYLLSGMLIFFNKKYLIYSDKTKLKIIILQFRFPNM